MREKPITVCLALLSAILLPLLALSQAAPQNLTLDMNGQQTQLPVKQLNGRNYVEVEALARAANGSVSFQGNAMRLTLPGSGGSSAAPSTQQAAPPANPGFSKEFSRAGIEAMAAIREWRSVLTNGVQNGYPIQSLGLSYYETQAQQALRLASVAANTDSDRNAYQLGASEFANMKKLSDKIHRHCSKSDLHRARFPEQRSVGSKGHRLRTFTGGDGVQRSIHRRRILPLKTTHFSGVSPAAG